MALDEDKLDALANVLRAIAEGAEERPRFAMSSATDSGTAPNSTTSQVRSSKLDVALLEILSAPSFDEPAVLQRLVADALQD
jgi:hypothetical protein